MFSIISLSFGVPSGEMYEDDIIESLMIDDADLPDGFMFGEIPEFAKDVLKENPWMMDRDAINRLTRNIYPDGDSRAVKSLYVSIITRKDVPYGDDIVYYALVFRDSASAQKEIKKLTEYTGYNKDRAVVLSKGNVAVYIHVDDTSDYHYIQGLSSKARETFHMQ